MNKLEYKRFRICFEEDKASNLICPCRCKGSMREVHPSCMEQWIKIKGTQQCEVCSAKLNLTLKYPSIHKVVYLLIKSLWDDKSKILKIALLGIYGQFLIKRLLSLKNDFNIIIKTSRKSWFLTFGLGALFGIYYAQLVFIFIKEVHAMFRVFMRTVRSTAHVMIGNYY